MAGVCIACSAERDDEDERAEDAVVAAPLRMNHVQVKATHNSYHKARWLFPTASQRYTFDPLDVQLASQGVRSFELDLHFDARRREFEVYHVKFDEGTTCPTLTACLTTMKRWSDANPRHVPIVVLLEAKDEGRSVDQAAYVEALESRIAAVWPRERLVTPDLVRGAKPNLRAAVTEDGWPELDAVRGRAMFVLTGDGELRRTYTRGEQSLDGRLVFAAGGSGASYASVVVMDDPKGQGDAIRDAVRAGFIVRTRADANMEEPRRRDRSRLDAALASGAQLVSTDVPVKVRDYGDYVVEIPGGTPGRCNPIAAPAGCTSASIEAR